MTKRILSLFLSVVFVLTVLPTAEASCSHARSLTASSGTLSGNYYLSADTQLTQNITVQGTSSLCLNGHTLELKGCRINLLKGATLTIRDCSGGGTIVATNPNNTDGVINVPPGSTLNFVGGGMQMTATSSCYDYGIANYGGTVNISGGNFTADIYTDYSSKYSITMALVYAGAGTTNISGGSFTANVLPPSSGMARAICAWVSGGTLNITGGSFTGDNYNSIVSNQRCPYPILVQSDDLYLGCSPDIYGIVCLYSFYGPSHLLHAKSTSGEDYAGSTIQLACINGSYSSHKLLVDDVTKGVNDKLFTLSSRTSGKLQLGGDHLVYYTSNSSYCSVKENESDGGKITTQPTCTSYGTKTYTCQICYSTRTETVSMLPHTKELIPAVPPTCTESGLTEGYGCYDCNYIHTPQQEVPPLGHTPVTDEAVEATCGQDGLSEGAHCGTCKTVITEQTVIPATGEHQYNLDAAISPTCTEPGLTAGSSCHACGYVHLAREPIPATGHTEVTDPGIPPTCTKTGLSDGSHCSACGEILISQEILPMTEHVPVTDPEVEATCTNTGLTQGSHCRNCGKVLTEQVTIPKKNHTVVIDDPVLPSCTMPGLSGTGLHCSICGLILLSQEEVPSLGHDHQTLVTLPTCTDEGYTTYTCSRCKDSYIDDKTEALGHTPSADATCTSPQTCTICDTELATPLGHDYIATTTLPTCTDEGYTTYTCSRCEDSYIDDKVVSLGHSPSAEATCTSPQTCTICGTELAAPLGHEYVSATMLPTCTDEGYTTYTCSRCEDSYVDDKTEALGHSPSAEATCTSPQTCAVCGTELATSLGHDYIGATTLPTCTTEGYTTYICSLCGDSYVDDKTDALGHHYGEPIFSWAEDLSQATVARMCICGEELSAECSPTWDDSTAGKLSVTAAAELADEICTETLEITTTIESGMVTVVLPCEIPNLQIIAAAYDLSGQLSNLLIPTLTQGTTIQTFSFSGQNIRIFFLGDNLTPLFPALPLS